MKAKIVHIDGETYLPEEMGKPADNQNQGSALDRLAEIACRICYDSFGKGRSSAELHKHIQEVGHLSVYEHCYIKTELKELPGAINPPPGFFYNYNHARSRYQIWFNIRHILETPPHPFMKKMDNEWGYLCAITKERAFEIMQTEPLKYSLMPINNDFISLYIECSRACSHELVRHGDYTAISQRSTRYVAENDTEYEHHPLDPMKVLEYQGEDWALQSRLLYNWVFDEVYEKLVSKGIDKSTALKQARGAARMYLPHSLQTKLIFTANIEQWYHMMRMRGALAADAEIRFLFVDHILPLIAHKIFKDKQVCDKCQGHQLLLDRHTGYDNDIIETEYPCPECNGCGYKDVVKKHDVLGNYVELPILPRSY